MGVVISGIVLACVIGLGAGFFFLNTQDNQPSWQVYQSTQSARVGDPGDNLVGKNWTGEGRNIDG